jgi:hypothetical protein
MNDWIIYIGITWLQNMKRDDSTIIGIEGEWTHAKGTKSKNKRKGESC